MSQQPLPCPGEGGSSHPKGEVLTGTQEGGRQGPRSLTGFALDVQGQRDALINESHDFLEILLAEVAGSQRRGTWGTGHIRGAPSPEANPTKRVPKSQPPWGPVPLSEPETASKSPRGVLREGGNRGGMPRGESLRITPQGRGWMEA